MMFTAAARDPKQAARPKAKTRRGNGDENVPRVRREVLPLLNNAPYMGS